VLGLQPEPRQPTRATQTEVEDTGEAEFATGTTKEGTCALLVVKIADQRWWGGSPGLGAKATQALLSISPQGENPQAVKSR
jgi:hypothetical protein